jgi:hypothetical protein
MSPHFTLMPEKHRGGFARKGKALVFVTRVSESLGCEAVNAILEESRDATFLAASRGTITRSSSRFQAAKRPKGKASRS